MKEITLQGEVARPTMSDGVDDGLASSQLV